MRLDDAWQAFFGRCVAGAVPGFPRYRTAARWRSWGCSEIRNEAFLRAEAGGTGFRSLGLLKIPNVDKTVAVRMHCAMPPEAKVVSCTFTKRGKRWEVGLQCRLPVTHGCETDEGLSDIVEDDVLGFDAGILTQAMDDHGNAYENERHGQRLAKAVRRAQRCAQRAKRGSKNSRKKKARVAGLRRKEANARSTSSRQNAARLVNEALATNMRVIAHEDLKIRNMIRSAAGTAAEPGTGVARKRGLNRALADVALGRFTRDVRSKAERAGLRCVAVDPRRTSQECWSCGTLVPKPLGQRVHDCPLCGFGADRDVNAALVIRKRAVARLRMDGTGKNEVRPRGRRGGSASRDREAPSGARSRRGASRAA